jgi:hypothetical protein
LPWRRSDDAGSAHRPEPGTRGSAAWTGREAWSSWLNGSPQPLIARSSDSRARRGGCARSSADQKRWQRRWAAGVTGRRTSTSARREPAVWATRLPHIAIRLLGAHYGQSCYCGRQVPVPCGRWSVWFCLGAGAGPARLPLAPGQLSSVRNAIVPNSGRCPSAYSCTAWHIPSRLDGHDDRRTRLRHFVIRRAERRFGALSHDQRLGRGGAPESPDLRLAVAALNSSSADQDAASASAVRRRSDSEMTWCCPSSR